ncbi:hypothetical protein KM043_013617 [Ampulex compressa]|nr:hypothetical protein KM043_013617 [Ampulex compressa]
MKERDKWLAWRVRESRMHEGRARWENRMELERSQRLADLQHRLQIFKARGQSQLWRILMHAAKEDRVIRVRTAKRSLQLAAS